MNRPSLSSETLHASCVSRDGRAVLIAGRSGAGKSDLALRLIDRGAKLVSDDYTLVRRIDGRLVASAPGTIAGKMEVRGLGILTLPTVSDQQVSLFVDLDRDVDRLPAPDKTIRIAGVDVPAMAANGLEASAPIKIELALDQIGLRD